VDEARDVAGFDRGSRIALAGTDEALRRVVRGFVVEGCETAAISRSSRVLAEIEAANPGVRTIVGDPTTSGTAGGVVRRFRPHVLIMAGNLDMRSFSAGTAPRGARDGPEALESIALTWLREACFAALCESA